MRWIEIDVSKQTITVESKGHRGQISASDKLLAVLAARYRRQHPKTEFVLGEFPAAVLHRVEHELREVASRLGIESASLSTLRRVWLRRLCSAELDRETLMAR